MVFMYVVLRPLPIAISKVLHQHHFSLPLDVICFKPMELFAKVTAVLQRILEECCHSSQSKLYIFLDLSLLYDQHVLSTARYMYVPSKLEQSLG